MILKTTDGYYLEHHGVKGQKWGIRRYQNRDGSLTPEGKARYNQEVTPKRTRKEQKQVRKMQKQWDSLHRKEWLKTYNEVADYANNVIIPKLNKQYGANEFSKLKFNEHGELIEGLNPDIEKRYKAYEKQEMAQYEELMNQKMSDLYDRIGYRPE